MEDEEILSLVADSLGAKTSVGTVTPLTGKQGLLVCRVQISGSRSAIFKAVRESHKGEVAIAERLAKLLPGTVPAVIRAALDEQRGLYWLVLEDEGPVRLSDQPTIAGYAQAAQRLAEVQIASLASIDELSELGVRIIDMQGWEEMSLGLLAAIDNRSLVALTDPSALSQTLWKVSEIAADAGALPESIVHGDLHAWNIAVRGDGSVRLLDWCSAFIGSAFLGLSELLLPAECHHRTLGDMGHVRKAYLDAWAPIVGKPGRLATAIAACDALARLSLLQEARRSQDRFGEYGAARAANRLMQATRQWERTRAC